MAGPAGRLRLCGGAGAARGPLPRPRNGPRGPRRVSAGTSGPPRPDRSRTIRLRPGCGCKSFPLEQWVTGRAPRPWLRPAPHGRDAGLQPRAVVVRRVARPVPGSRRAGELRMADIARCPRGQPGTDGRTDGALSAPGRGTPSVRGGHGSRPEPASGRAPSWPPSSGTASPSREFHRIRLWQSPPVAILLSGGPGAPRTGPDRGRGVKVLPGGASHPVGEEGETRSSLKE